MTSKYKKGPDGGWGWVVVFAAFIIHFICDGIMYTTGLFIDEFHKHLNTSETMASFVVTMNAGLSLMVGPIAGALINAWDCKSVAILGAVLTFIGNIFTAMAPNIYVALFTFGIIAGCGFGFLYVSSVIIISVYFHKKLGMAAALSSSGTGLGTIAFAPIEERMIHDLSWRTAFYINGALMLPPLLCSFLLRSLKMTRVKPGEIANMLQHADKINKQKLLKREELKAQGGEITDSAESSVSAIPSSEDDKNEDDPNKIEQGSMWESNNISTCDVIKESFGEMFGHDVLLNYNFIVFSIATTLMSLGYLAPYLYIKDRALQLKIGTDNQASWLLSILGIGSFIGRLLFGTISDLHCLRQFRMWLYIGMALICGAVTMLAVLCTEYWQLAIFAIVYGTFSGGDVTLMSVVLTDLFSVNELPNVIGQLSLFEGIATCIPLAGWIFQKTKSLTWSFIICGSLYFIGGLVLILIPLKYKVEECLMKKKKEDKSVAGQSPAAEVQKPNESGADDGLAIVPVDSDEREVDLGHEYEITLTEPLESPEAEPLQQITHPSKVKPKVQPKPSAGTANKGKSPSSPANKPKVPEKTFQSCVSKN